MTPNRWDYLTMATAGALGYTWSMIGYPFTTWQFWLMVALLALHQFSAYRSVR